MNQTYQTRPAFTKQPIQYVFVDICRPIESENLAQICDSLLDVLSLSASMRGSSRIPMLGLTVLSGDNHPPICLFPLQCLKGNFHKVASAVNTLRSMTIEPNDNRMDVQSALIEAINEAKENIKNGPYHMQMTLISMQPISKLTNSVQEALKSADLENIKKFQILSFFTDSELHSDLEEPYSGQCIVPCSSSRDASSGLLHELLDTTIIHCDSYALEGFFKGWLQDFTTDKEHLNLHLGPNVVVKCDLHEPLLNPGAFLYSNCFFLSTDPLVSYGPMANYPGNKNNDVPTYELEAMNLLKNSSVCESLVYGMPLFLCPTLCWKMEWTDIETNRHRFQSLRQSLKERDSVLLVRTKLLNQVAKFHDQTPCGHFLVFAADTATLLIKPVACRELLLPPIDGGTIEDDFVPREVQNTTDACLDRLDKDDKFNPVNLQSGLMSPLRASLSNTESAVKQIRAESDILKPKPRRVIRFNVPTAKRFEGFRPASVAFQIKPQ